MLADTLRRAGARPGVVIKTGSFVKQAGVGNQDITLPAGTPNLVGAPSGSWAVIFFDEAYAATSGVVGSHALGGIGMVANGGGTISEFAISHYSQDGQVTSNTARRGVTRCITAPDGSGSTFSHDASFVGFISSTTMRINWVNNGSGASTIHFVIIAGLKKAKVVKTVLGGSTGLKSITGAGFKPSLVLHASCFIPSGNSSLQHSYFGMGMFNKQGQQWADSYFAYDAQTPANTSRWQRVDSNFLFVDPSEAPVVRCFHTSMDADGYSMYAAVNTMASTWELISLCMDGISSKIGGIMDRPSVGSEIMSTRHGFYPKGAIFSGTHNAPAAAPAAHATWFFGASDFVNHRVIAYSDQDAVNPSNVDSIFRNDNALLHFYNAGQSTRGYPSARSVDDVTIQYDAANSSAFETLYCLLGDDGVDSFPSLITSYATNDLLPADTTAYPNQKKGVTLSTGRRVVVNKVQGGVVYGLFSYSDDGITWTKYASTINGWVNGSIASYVDSGGTERLVAVWKQSYTGGGRTIDYLYAMVGSFNVDRTTITWGTPVVVASQSGTDYEDFPDVVVNTEDTGAVAHFVNSYRSGVNGLYAVHRRCSIDAAGVISAPPGSTIIGGTYTQTSHLYPSIDIDLVTKRLFAAWSTPATGTGQGVRFKTASYSAGVWTWASEVTVDNTRRVDFIDYRWLVCRWDGSRVLIGGNLIAGSGNDLMLYESTNFTAFTTRTLITAGVYTPCQGAMIVNPVNGDVHFLGRGANSDATYLFYYKWTRATLTLEGGKRLDAIQSGAPWMSGWYSTGRLNFVYTQGNGSYSAKYDRILV